MPYTTEQINIVSKMVRLQGASIESALETLGAFERFNGGEEIYVDERTGEVVYEPFVVRYDFPAHCGYRRSWFGELLKRNRGRVAERYYHDRQSALLDGWVECEKCGRWFRHDNPERLTIGESDFCSSDCANDAGYYQCEHCGDWVHEDDAVDACDYIYCGTSCAERDGYYQCEHCGEWHETLQDVRSTYGTVPWCGSCVDNDAYRCDDCGAYMTAGASQHIGNSYYCPECAENHQDHLHEYGYVPPIRFFGVGPLYLGVELETDSGYDRMEYCDDLMGIEGFPDRFWMTKDGSLDNGVEITSMPMTLAEHVACHGMYELIAEAARSHGFVSHNSGRCGLHIHVSRAALGKSEVVQDAGGYKMMRLLQRFERQFHIFSRRTDTNWCSYKTCGNYEPMDDAPSISKRDDQKEPGVLRKAAAMKRETTHAQALNFQHGSTFEFRIFRGTLKWETYYACLAIVEGIVHTVKQHGSTWVESVTWYDLIDEIVGNVTEEFPKKCLEEYLEEKGLR